MSDTPLRVEAVDSLQQSTPKSPFLVGDLDDRYPDDLIFYTKGRRLGYEIAFPREPRQVLGEIPPSVERVTRRCEPKSFRTTDGVAWIKEIVADLLLGGNRMHGFGKRQSINLIVRSQILQQNGLRAFVLDELEDEPQVVSGTARPGTRQFAFQFVCFQPCLKGIFYEGRQRGFEIRAHFGMFLHQPPCCPHEHR